MTTARAHARARATVNALEASLSRAGLFLAGGVTIGLAGVVTWPLVVAVAAVTAIQRRTARLGRLVPGVVAATCWLLAVTAVAAHPDGSGLVGMVLVGVGVITGVGAVLGARQARTVLEESAVAATLGPVSALGAHGTPAVLLAEHLAANLDADDWRALAGIRHVPDVGGLRATLARAAPAGTTPAAWTGLVDRVTAADDAVADVLHDAAAVHLDERDALRASEVAAWAVRGCLYPQAFPPGRDPVLPHGLLQRAWAVIGPVSLTAERARVVAATVAVGRRNVTVVRCVTGIDLALWQRGYPGW